MRAAVFLVFGLMFACAGPAAAQVSKDMVEATAGDWLLAPEDGRPGCRVRMRTNEVIGGYELRASPSCLGVRTMMLTAVAWRFDAASGGLAFSGPERETLLAFTEKEDGTYATDGAPGDVLLLIKAPAGVEAVPNAANIFGEWAVMEGGGGAEVCRITFADTPPPGGEESYALKVSERCEAKLAALKLASWRIEGLNLMLYSPTGESFAFAPASKGTFIAADAKPPLMLVRRDRS